MIFKQIFGKTVEAAMKSAKQIYGDDFTVFQTLEGDKNQQPGISLIADRKVPKTESSQQRKKQPVYFEKSRQAARPKRENEQINVELQALRKIAETQISDSAQKQSPGNQKANNGKQKKTKFSPVPHEKLNQNSKPLNVYSRKSVRATDTAIPAPSKPDQSERNTVPEKRSRRTKSLLNRFDESKPNFQKPLTTQTVFKQPETQHTNRSEIKALHERFDKLEALLHSDLISANMEYAAHPVFQQLVQTGIPTKVVSEWFKRIVKKNVDPFNESDIFVSEISRILKSALSKDYTIEPNKFQLFLGYAGAGKTSLIMKLILDNDLSDRTRTAVVSVLPVSHKQHDYYTILEPFCNENGIDYFKVGIESDLADIYQDLNNYQHIYIDTPSLAVEENRALAEYGRIEQILAPISNLTVHLIVNMTAHYHDSQILSASSLSIQPDYIALTHLDEMEAWGPIIPLFEKVKCSGSYISTGDSLTGTLECFDAAWLTKNILENT